jgi:hypothetical protein
MNTSSPDLILYYILALSFSAALSLTAFFMLRAATVHQTAIALQNARPYIASQWRE